MVVQHNLTALNANRYLGINNTKLSKSLEKLSSGYAINRAGDNAAGLAVSEKMRSQIAGMTQGAKNAQDGISMIQTFEGALTETDSILQRMKTLADQSANGTYQSEVDRDAIELEFKQLNDELNQIADTDYNGVVMLNGGVMADGTPVNNVNVESYKPIIKYHQYGTGDNSLIYSQSVNGSMTTAGTGSITINGVKVNIYGGKSNALNSQAGAGVADPGYKPNGMNAEQFMGEDLSGMSTYTVDGLKYDAETGWSGEIKAEEYYAVKEGQTTITINGETFDVDWGEDGKTFTGLKFQAGRMSKDGTTDLGGQNVTEAETGFKLTADTKNHIVPDGGDKPDAIIGEVKLEYEYAIDAKTGIIYNKASGDVVGSMSLSQGVSTSNSYNHGNRNLTYSDSLTLQAGARSKDSIRFNFNYTTNGIGTLFSDMDCSARGLGTDQLTLASQEEANFAIDQIDNAINKVSMVRATFGAAQNRLEHKIDNLNVSIENLTSAESEIRDTDMPTEMMNFTKMQILAQASQSMLAQANSLPQSVLSLLQ